MATRPKVSKSGRKRPRLRGELRVIAISMGKDDLDALEHLCSRFARERSSMVRALIWNAVYDDRIR